MENLRCIERSVPALVALVGLLLFGCDGSNGSGSNEGKEISTQQEVRLVSRLDSVVYFYDRYVEASGSIHIESFTPEQRDSLIELIAKYERLLGDLSRHVDQTTWKAARDSFRHRFDNYGGDGLANSIWPKDSVAIDVTSFLTIMEKYRPNRDVGSWQNDSLPGVLFYYGTDAHDALALGVEFLGLKWEDGNKKELKYTDGTGHFFRVDAEDGTLKAAELGVWVADHWNNKYLVRALVRNPDLKNYGEVVLARDAHAEAYYSPHFEFLSASNNGGGGGKFIVTSACDPAAVPKDYTPHRLMVHVVDAANIRRLDDVPNRDKPLYNKALELGSPCPPGCKKVAAP